MGRRVSLTTIAAGLAATATLAVGCTTPDAPGTPVGQTCEKYGSIRVQDGRYIVQNNNWGTDTPQCIDVTTNGLAIRSISAVKPTNGAPASYPSIYLGCHYGNCSAGSGLPRPVSAISSVASSVSITPAAGQWDAAYDLWFDPTPRTDGQNTGAEIMVWVNHQGGPQPVGSKVATASIAGATWDVWYGNIGWNVISYVRQQVTTAFSGDLLAFTQDAAGQGHLQRSWYLTSVQFGFEPWTGGQGLAVNSFSATVS